MRKLLATSIIILLLTTSLTIPIQAHITNNGISHVFSKPQRHAYSTIQPRNSGPRVETHQGIPILYVNGSYYDMGYQHGSLLEDEVRQTMRAFLAYINQTASYETMLTMWNTTQPYVPQFYLDEMHGIADGANFAFEKIAVAYMFVLHMDMQCFSFAATANATTDNQLYHVRSLDFPLTIQDPVTGTYIEENSVIIVRQPTNHLHSICPSIAGGLNFYEGINEKQISITAQVCWSHDQTLKGIPTQFRIQKALDHATTIDQAITILTTNTTLGWNFIVSDGKTSTAYAVETTANQSYVGQWNNPVEGTPPFWQINNVIRRTNFFIEPTIAATQRKQYDPSGLTVFLKMFIGSSFFLLWRKYKAMSEEIQQNWGTINLNTSISLLRKVYTGKTDVFMYLIISLLKNSILCDFHQWAFCPKTGGLVISFANDTQYSHETQLHYFNIYDLFGT